MRRKPATAYLIAASVLYAVALPSAHAVATATANMSVVSWTLTDLNLADGITPALVLSSTFSYSSTNLVGYANSPFQNIPGSYQPTSASGSNLYGSGSANTSATGAQTSVILKGSTALGTQVFQQAVAYPIFGNFTLSANTLVSFTVPYALATNTTVGQLDANSESAQAAANFQLNVSSVNGSSNFSANASTYASSTYIPSTGLYTGASSSRNGTLELLFANRSNSDVTGNFYAYAQAYIYSSLASPVPEATTGSLMALGLAALAFGRRSFSRPT